MILIRKIIIFILLLFCMCASTGCRGEPPTKQYTEAAEIKNVVSKYLEAEQSNNHSYMSTLLTGEALAEASINFNRRQIQKKHLRTELKEEIITPELAAVYTDITAQYSDPSFKDRYALNFYLIQRNGHWLIYKVEPVALERPLLSPGEIPPDAKKVLKDYFSLPFELKKHYELEYLASQNLSSLAQMNLYRVKPADTSKGFVVEDIKCLGYSERYCIAEVTYQGGNNDVKITAVVDIVEAGGQWKIAWLGIIGQEKEREEGGN